MAQHRAGSRHGAAERALRRPESQAVRHQVLRAAHVSLLENKQCELNMFVRVFKCCELHSKLLFKMLNKTFILNSLWLKKVLPKPLPASK